MEGEEEGEGSKPDAKITDVITPTGYNYCNSTKNRKKNRREITRAFT